MGAQGSFIFYPVGQGCFYAGTIEFKSKQFVVVYDCGTVSNRRYLQDSITAFRDKFTKIDLLIISHFDEDHVNGVKDLLNGMPCDRVIIPYYQPIARLSLWSNTVRTEDYTLFIANPINFFLNTEGFKVKEVIVIDDNSPGFAAGDFKAPTPLKPDVVNENEDNNNEILFEEVKNEDENFKEKVKALEKENFIVDNRVKYLSLPFRLSFTIPFWEFVFYLRFFEKTAAITAFEKDIEAFLIKIKETNIKSLFDDEFRENVRMIYRKHIHGNINYSSLVVFHSPTFEITETYFFKSWDDFNLKYLGRGYETVDKGGTLLTGDSFLKTRVDFDHFYNYFFPDYIKQCVILQVPHHGAKANWKNMPNGLEDIPNYLINHGLARKHPFAEVLINIYIESTSKSILSNNEVTPIHYFVESI